MCLQNFKTVHPGQHEIKDDQIILIRERRPQPLIPVFRMLTSNPLSLQIILFQISDGLFVFNNQYSAHLPVPPDIF